LGDLSKDEATAKRIIDYAVHQLAMLGRQRAALLADAKALADTRRIVVSLEQKDR